MGAALVLAIIRVIRTMSKTLQRISEILESRKDGDPSKSYVAGLFREGLDQILRKVGEEAIETILAAKGNDREALIHETADLWFHTLMMLAAKEMGPDEVLAELERRFGVSGLAEKASRTQE